MSEIDRQTFEAKVTPSGEDEYTVDLSEFAFGRGETQRGVRYSGRPGFAREIIVFFETENPTQKNAKVIRVALRQLFRYLDWRARRHPDEIVASCADIKDSHGVQLRQWLAGGGMTFRRIKTTLNNMRSLSGLGPLFWSNRRPDRENCASVLDQEALSGLFKALKREGRTIKAMFADGALLASRGVDPRGRTHGWKSAENRAWMVRHLLEAGLPDHEGLASAHAAGLLLHPGPNYLAPRMKETDARGLVGNLRWFVPSRSDTGVFLWLFLLGTGWNLSTAGSIDVLDPSGWCQPHPQNDRFMVIHAFKRRADRHQFAISMTRPEWHPYRIIQFMIERTKPLRDRVLVELAETRRRAADDPNLKLGAEIKRLEQLSRTPWLFAGRGSTGTVSGFMGDSRNRGLLDIARLTAIKSGLTSDYFGLFSIVTKDARQGWIGRAFVHSGYHLVLTKLAGSHTSLRSTRHYIRSHRYRAHSEVEVRKLQNAVFSDIECGRVLDPTRLRLLVERGKITSEQERRLVDYRKRTRVGMGCLDPRSPPKQIDPDHPDGALCRIQRCTGCPNGVVFPESMPPLARRYAELLQLKRTMPTTGWTDSSLADEYESIEQTLTHFESNRVSAEVAAWTAKLTSGEIAVYGTYPSY